MLTWILFQRRLSLEMEAVLLVFPSQAFGKTCCIEDLHFGTVICSWGNSAIAKLVASVEARSLF